MAMKPEISVKNLLMQAFLTGWERSDKSISQDEYLQSAIPVSYTHLTLPTILLV